MIEKVVIPAAGLGTRLLSATKEQPKEMLPIFARDHHGNTCVKPIVQLIFEQLFDFGLRRFYFIVGRQKRALEDHFTPDSEFVARLDHAGKNSQAGELEHFYRQVKESTLLWVNQPAPLGFGHALLQARPFISDEPFLVHAGDTYIISEPAAVLKRLVNEHAKSSADATLTLEEVQDTSQYGVAEVVSHKEGLSVQRVEEKPAKPKSNLAIMPLYVFQPSIFEALGNTHADKGGEIQLTDAIQRLIDTGHTVQAIELQKSDLRFDIGTPETYWEALELSHRYSISKPLIQS
jgi:UTP--glucose-1-phosphate uridylyltransferase